MPIPKEILSVHRPKSTRVRQSGKRWLVIKTTSQRIPGRKNPKCIELGTIGEIVNGVYREIRKEPRKSKETKLRIIDIKDYGQVAICNKLGEGLFDDLNSVYDADDAKRIYIIALLRAAYPDIRDRDLKFRYETSYLSEMYQGVALSENSVTAFLEKIGMNSNKIKQFMQNRMNASEDDTKVVDGVLKSNNSITNCFSEFSKKGKIKGSRNISIMYSYSLNKQEPVACRIYPGNMLDLRSIKDFLEYCNSKGEGEFKWKTFKTINQVELFIPENMIMGDKGFTTKEVLEYLDENKIPYLLPLKLDSTYITNYGMNDDFCDYLNDYDKSTIFYKKVKMEDGRFLYAFRDLNIERIQKIAYINCQTSKNTYNEQSYKAKSKEFGLIVFISNANLAPIVAYLCYKNRWDIEPIFHFNKTILDLDTVNVQGDYRLYASEFISFIASIIGCRIRNKFNITVLRKKTLKNLNTSEYQEDISIDDIINATNENDSSEELEEQVKDNNQKKKTKNQKNIYISDEYTYPEVFTHLSKCKCMRNDSTQTWSMVITVKYIEELVKALDIPIVNK